MISVPAQLTICGFDDTPLASSIWPNLTTVRQPIQQMSRSAVKILVQTMWLGEGARQDHENNSVELSFQLIRRQTDAIPAYH
jgi:LacI family transcriptional regulator